MSALKRNQETAIIGKQKDTAQKETLAVSATMKINVEKHRNRFVLHQNRTLKAVRSPLVALLLRALQRFDILHLQQSRV